MIRLATLPLTLLGLALLATPATATTLLEVGVPAMTRTSQWVVRAQVVAVTPVDLRGEGAGLFTDVTLEVAEVYRGHEVPQTHVLRLLGGAGADGTSLWIPGMPRFSPGEDVVLFLERTPRGQVPCGLAQGVWRVAPDAQGSLWVRQSEVRAHVVRRDADGGLVEAPEPVSSGVQLLDELVAEVYAAQLEP